MGSAWIGFAGVALGAVLGLLPRFWDRRDAREQREADAARTDAEAAARQRSHRNGALMKCARTTNEFLAARAHADNVREDEGERRTGVGIALDRGAEMMTAWTEALLVIGDDQRRAVLDDLLREASHFVGKAESLGALADVAERGLVRLIGIDPTP